MANKNSISVYLIKEKYEDDKDFLKNFNSLKLKKINEAATFYYGKSSINKPKWIKQFFVGSIDEISGDIKTTGAQAILIIRSENRIFAIPFGYGWHYLDDGVFEEKFGLKLAINSIDESCIRKVTKKNVAIDIRDNQEQLAQFNSFNNFSFDTEQDLIQEITGLSNHDSFKKNITGKDAIHFSSEVDMSNIKEICAICLQQYNSEQYKQNFSWIDYIKAIKNKNQVEKLNNKLIEKIINSNFDKLWMAVPEIINWNNVTFSYTTKKNSPRKDDINLQDFLEHHNNAQEEISLNTIKKPIYVFDLTTESETYHWPAYKCLYCEINEGDKVFLLSNGKWYEIANDFVQKINNFYNDKINQQDGIELISHIEGNKESVYNERLSVAINAINMDTKNIMIGGGYSRVEFCDVLTKNKELIHVKKYGNSTMLGHLFNQGLVSAQTFLNDKNFREEVNNKINNPDYSLPDDFIEIRKYKVIFAIISKHKERLNIPFFSKVVMKSVFINLENIGFKASIKQINVEI